MNVIIKPVIRVKYQYSMETQLLQLIAKVVRLDSFPPAVMKFFVKRQYVQQTNFQVNKELIQLKMDVWTNVQMEKLLILKYLIMKKFVYYAQ